MMQRLEKFRGANLLKLVAITLIFSACFAMPCAAQRSGQKTFPSAEDAANALAKAAQSNDEKAMLETLGPDAKQIVSSGDDAEDASSRANFVQRYQEMHRLMKEPDGTTTLYIGAHNWPTPIPIVNKGKFWYFDTDAAKQEILFRRVGRNEMSAIRVCQELAAAQKEYSAQHGEYSQKIYSDQGQHNGLYWKAANSEPQSPIGPLVAAAVATNDTNTNPAPYRGYYFHSLARQGKGAPGGAKTYLVNGKMTGGFAFIAYPAEYRSSGVMTFLVSADGAVYEKDLGKKTETLARDMKEFNLNSSWQKNEDMHEAADAKY